MVCYFWYLVLTQAWRSLCTGKINLVYLWLLDQNGGEIRRLLERSIIKVAGQEVPKSSGNLGKGCRHIQVEATGSDS